MGVKNSNWRLCSDDVVRSVVRTANTYAEALAALGLERNPVTIDSLKRHIAELGVSTEHFYTEPIRRRGRRPTWTDDALRAAVQSSVGYAETTRKLGLVPRGGNYVQVRRRIKELELDTSHFLGHGWNIKGRFIKSVARPLEEVLVAG